MVSTIGSSLAAWHDEAVKCSIARQPWRRAVGRRSCTKILALLFAGAISRSSPAQDMLRFLDLKSDDFTKAEMTRTEIEAALAAADATKPLDLSAKRLNGLDLSGLDLRHTKLQAARLNRA